MNERPTRCLLCEARLSNPICQLSPSSLSRFSLATTTASYRPGDVLFSQGDRSGEVFILRSGQVKITYEHTNGVEQILRWAGPGETLGVGMASDHSMIVGAMARTTTFVCRMELNDIERLVRTDSDFALAWSQLLMDEVRRARETVFNLGPHPACVRLARYLVQARRSPSRERGGPGFPAVVMTHADLAASLAIAQETATRLLRDLEQKSVVTLSRGRIEIIDLDRLVALAGYPGSEVDLAQRA